MCSGQKMICAAMFAVASAAVGAQGASAVGAVLAGGASADGSASAAHGVAASGKLTMAVSAVPSSAHEAAMVSAGAAVVSGVRGSAAPGPLAVAGDTFTATAVVPPNRALHVPVSADKSVDPTAP
ncbi:hypothetical protein [Candidatus Symbiobacter mobilis]|uniref:Uncharacterized protein n=1 Tax=Candidatus Symbiobacter mobilis CR TaxID=946483 RepID=U5N7M4_9BURK|nr:hypothetical protein [Candidatus Symbiobacter mobilis]AGX87320.1 hypothetical protein Cenrod_1228 [Candidatus Symbiobacter mobilis CR]